MIPAVHAMSAAAKAVGHPALPAECGALLEALEHASGRNAEFDFASLLEGHRDGPVATVFLRPDAFVVTSAADRDAAHAMQRLLVYAVDRQIELAPVGPQQRALQRGTAPFARSLREALGAPPGALPAGAVAIERAGRSSGWLSARNRAVSKRDWKTPRRPSLMDSRRRGIAHPDPILTLYVRCRTDAASSSDYFSNFGSTLSIASGMLFSAGVA